MHYLHLSMANDLCWFFHNISLDTCSGRLWLRRNQRRPEHIFSPTWSGGSRQRHTTSSGWKYLLDLPFRDEIQSGVNMELHWIANVNYLWANGYKSHLVEYSHPGMDGETGRIGCCKLSPRPGRLPAESAVRVRWSQARARAVIFLQTVPAPEHHRARFRQHRLSFQQNQLQSHGR